jgi:hypothetical protein
MTSQRATQKMTPREITAFKLRARRLFSLSYGFKYLAGVSTIRLVFPAFRGDQGFTEWADLIDACLEKIEADEFALLPNYKKITSLVHSYPQYECYGLDTFMGTSYKVMRRDANGKLAQTVGTVGYNSGFDNWYFSTRTTHRKFASCQQAVKFMAQVGG